MGASLRWTILVVLACLVPVVARADSTAGDEPAKKLAQAAMQKSYMAGDFDVALRKLGQAVTLCRAKGCSPSVSASLFGSQAIVHWVGTEDQAAATEDLRAMVKADPTFQLDDTDAPPELMAALEAMRAEAKKGAKVGGAAPSASVTAKPAVPAVPVSKDESKEAAKAPVAERPPSDSYVPARSLRPLRFPAVRYKIDAALREYGAPLPAGFIGR